MPGWTIPTVAEGVESWTLTGTCDGLFTDDAAVAASATGATEVQFVIPRGHRAWYFLEQFVTTARPDGGFDQKHLLTIGDATVRFRFEPDANLLTIATFGSALLPLTLTENWLGEPLRILFGQLAFPRLVARAFPKGGASIRVSRSPGWQKDSDWVALWQNTDFDGKDRFWRLYAALLTYVARAGEYERHNLTTLYEETIQASGGSRWLSALTLASSIEGVVRMISPRGSKRPDVDDGAIAALSDYIKAWKHPDPERPKAVVARLKELAIHAVQGSTQTTPGYVLGQLAKAGVVSKRQVDAWTKIRNAVAHGNLVSPYSSAEDDALLLALADLLHRLTKEVVSPTVSWGAYQN